MIPKWDGDGHPPLSHAQERLWFIEQLTPGTPLYNLPLALEIEGPLDQDALRAAINEILARHSALRTTFRMEGGEAVQVIAPPGGVDIGLVDLSDRAEPEREAELNRILADRANRPFDLERGPLLRSTLIRQSGARYLLLNVQHHIIFDGWSWGIFINELAELYRAFAAGRRASLPETPPQYADFAARQRSETGSEADERHLAHWREALAGELPVLAVPTDLPRPTTRTHHGATERAELPVGLLAGVAQCAGRHHASPFMLLLAAYKALLYRCAGQEDLIVACPMAARTDPEIENAVGFFVNTLPIRTAFGRNWAFADLLKTVQKSCLKAYANQDVPFQRIVEELSPDRSTGLNPLFQTMFSFEDLRELPERIGEAVMRPRSVDHDGAIADLLFEVELHRDRIGISLTYSTDLFVAETARRMLRRYEAILLQILEDPGISLLDLDLLTESERKSISEWNATDRDFPSELCVHELFERQANATPGAVAAIDATGPTGEELGSITFAELDERAGELASHLRGLGVGPDSLVGVCVGRSIDMLVGVLGILKAGGAYVPLDAGYPTERLEFMVEDAGVQVLLAREATADVLPGFGGTIVRLDDDRPAAAGDDGTPSGVTPDNLAYVIFTSGSTGKPKGVAMPHRTLTNLVTWQVRTSSVAEGAKTLQFAPLSFDVSFQELFATWCAGGTLVLIDSDLRLDASGLIKFMRDRSIERIFVPFVTLQYLAEAAAVSGPPCCLKEVITAGEQLQINRHVIDLFSALPECVLWNQYGPTEGHVVTALRLDGDPAQWPALPPIGRPIDNVKIHILDGRMQPCPVGVRGELYIGGAAVVRGYLNRPDLTAERFVTDPFADEPGARLYRTGDLALYRSNGNIEFLGRADSQLKIRGFRVEPGEIESALTADRSVSRAAISVWEPSPGDKRLVAYYVPTDDEAPTVTELRKRLRTELPDYMVPHLFVQLDSFPTTPSGKVDREKLPAPTTIGPGPASAPPKTDAEQLVAGIWCESLGVETVGLQDNFFDLGGHSLLAMQIVAKIEDRSGARLTPHDVLFGTLGSLAARVAPAMEGNRGAAPERRRSLMQRLIRREAKQ